jgi:hypothetical protein
MTEEKKKKKIKKKQSSQISFDKKTKYKNYNIKYWVYSIRYALFYVHLTQSN